MKNLKKVLAMVLAFACTFSMFAGAKVFEDVPAGSDYSEAVTMLSDLGVIQGKDDGKYHPEDTITRAEACAMIARLMTGDPKVSQYVGAQSFTDVAKGSWKDSAIGYCYINGIVIGVGNNKFEPDRAITDAEFVTMVVRAMGYETADMKQNYPFSYMSNAQAVGLLDGTNMVASTDALRGEDAQVIYNALFADYARGAKLVNTTHGTSVETYPTLAESVWGLNRAAVGTWQKSSKDDETLEMTTCKAHTWVITGEVVKVGSVDMFTAYPIDDDATELYEDGKKVDGYAFTYNGDMANIADLKGYQVELWGMGAHDEPELKKTEDGKTVYSYDWDINAIKTVKGQTKFDYTPADEALPDVDFDDVRGFVGGTEFKGTNLVWGNKSLKEDDVKDALETKNSASYRVVDWDSDGAADFIVGDIYDYYKVDAVTSKTVRLVGMNGEKFTLDKDGETDVTIDDEKYTVTAEFPKDLEEGDIIEVTKSEVAEKKVIKSTWTVKVVEAETKELTKVDTKKGAYFDDELIHDAEKHNKVQYFFDDTDKTYGGLNEKSEDSWDLYRDANGFIVFMEPSDEAWAGYIYVTGASNGNSNTGSRNKYAEIAGVNDKNEKVKDTELVKDADVEINGKDAFDDYTFKANPKGRVFHYAVNEDGKITKMVELATNDGAEDYTYTDKTDAATVNGRKYWLDDADVIFAVETSSEFKNNKAYDNNKKDVTVAKKYDVNGTDLDDGNVIAVKVDEIPDIATGEVTTPEGIRYDGNTTKDEHSAVVLGVNTLRYFSNTSVEAGLLTNMTYNKKDDTYTATAYVAGRDGEEFTTIDADDVTIAGDTKLDELYKVLTKGNDAKNGIYCEFEFNKDGKITALSPMNNAYVQYSMKHLTNDAGIEYNVIANDDGIPATYEVSRVVVNKVTSDKALTVSGAQATSEDNKVYSVENAQYVGAYDLTDKTAYYKVTDEKVDMTAEQVLNPWFDGFKDGYEVEAGSLDELDSYIRNYSDKYDDEYVVADVILDDGDVVAVYYYDELVGEYGYVKGAVDAKDVAYSAQPATADVEVTLADYPELDRTKVYVTVEGQDKKYDLKLDKDGKGSVELPVVNAGTYTVTAYGYNKAADKYQVLGTDKWTVAKDAYTVQIIKNNKQNSYPALNELTVGSDTVWVKVTNDNKGNAGVTGLTADDFNAVNNQNLSINVEKATAGADAGYYELKLSRGVQEGDDLTISVKEATNNKVASDDVKVVEGEQASTLTLNVQNIGQAESKQCLWVYAPSKVDLSDKSVWTVAHNQTEDSSWHEGEIDSVRKSTGKDNVYVIFMKGNWDNSGLNNGSKVKVSVNALSDGQPITGTTTYTVVK